MDDGVTRRTRWWGLVLVLVVVLGAIWWSEGRSGDDASSTDVAHQTSGGENVAPPPPSTATERRGTAIDVAPEAAPTDVDDALPATSFGGTVVDAATNSPLAGATVSAHLMPVGRGPGDVVPAAHLVLTTDADGAFAGEVPGASAGVWYLQAVASGYVATVSELRSTVRFRLARPRSVTVEVVDRRGDPIEGAQVARQSRAGVPLAFVAAPGPVELRAGGGDRLLVRAPGRPPQRFSAPDGMDIVRVVLMRGLPIAGRVVRADGTPLAGLAVRLGTIEFRRLAPIRTDEAGRFRFGSVPARGRVTVEVVLGEDEVLTQSVAPGRTDVEFVAAQTGTVRCRVVAPDGSPAQGVRLHGFPDATDAQGVTEWTTAPVGELALYATKGLLLPDAGPRGPARFEARGTVVVRAGTTKETLLRLEERHASSVRVVARSSDGAVLRGRRVLAMPGTHAVTDAEGSAELTAFAARGDRVTVRLVGSDPSRFTEATVEAGAAQPVELREVVPPTLSVRLRGPQGGLSEEQRATASVVVVLRSHGGARADRDGDMFRVTVPPEDALGLLVTVPDVGATWHPLEAADFAGDVLDVTVRPTALVVIRTPEAIRGTSVELAVTAMRSGLRVRTGRLESTESGALLTEVPAGPIDVTVAMGGATVLAETLALQPGERVVRHVELRPALRVEGVVHDAQGRPLGGALLVPLHRAFAPPADVTGPDGRFVVDLPAAGTPLLVDRDGFALTVVRPTTSPHVIRLRPGGEILLHWAPEHGSGASRIWLVDPATGEERQLSSLGQPGLASVPGAVTALVDRIPPGDHDVKVEIHPDTLLVGRVTVASGERIVVRMEPR